MQTGKQQSRNKQSFDIWGWCHTPFQSYITKVCDDSDKIRSPFHFTIRRTNKTVCEIRYCKKKAQTSRAEKKNEEIISRNSLPHYKRASSFTNKREAAWLHLLPKLSRYRRMSESVQHDEQCSSLHDRWCLLYDEQCPSLHDRWCLLYDEQCPSLHAEGLTTMQATHSQDASNFVYWPFDWSIWICSTCFGRQTRPSSGTLSDWYNGTIGTMDRYCCRQAAMSVQNCEKRALDMSCHVCLSIRLSVRLSACSNSASNGRIFMKFNIWVFLRKSVEKISSSIKIRRNDAQL